MKRLLLTALSLGLIATNAVAATVEFRGGLCLLSVTSQCALEGYTIGDCFLLRYSPPNLDTNGPTTEFSLLGGTSANNYSLASGSLVGTTFKSVSGKHVGRTGSSFAATMRIPVNLLCRRQHPPLSTFRETLPPLTIIQAALLDFVRPRPAGRKFI